MPARIFTTFPQFALAVGMTYAWLALPAAAQSLECPIPQPMHDPGVMKETPAQIAETGSFLASGDNVNRAPEVVADLRKRYPGVSDVEVQNYLVTAYCPVVAKLNGLSVAEQRSRLDQFAHHVSVAVYGR